MRCGVPAVRPCGWTLGQMARGTVGDSEFECVDFIENIAR
jgi:hypothetical protein